MYLKLYIFLKMTHSPFLKMWKTQKKIIHEKMKFPIILSPPGDTLTIFRGRLSFKKKGERRNYQPAEVLEADIELVPTANMPAVGAVDVICGGEMVRGLFWGPALCSNHGGSQSGGRPDRHICGINE